MTTLKSISNHLTIFGKYSFFKTRFSFITCPTELLVINDGCFHTCTSMTSILFNSKITTIGQYAFQNCLSLTNIILPDSITSISNNSFYGCSSLNLVYMSQTLKNRLGLSFGNNQSFYGTTTNIILYG